MRLVAPGSMARSSSRSRMDQPRDRSRAVKPQYDPELFGRLSERVARFIGSARFIGWMTVFVITWLLWNILAPDDVRFDPFPFIFLTLMLSLQASYAAPLILLAQNRQADRDRVQYLEDRNLTERLVADPTLALDELPWFYDEPLADPSTVPTFLVSRMAREHVTVALSGDGGDETFGGYRRYVHDQAENKLRRAVGPFGRRLCGALGSIYPKLDRAPRFLRGKSFLTNVGSDPARAYFQSVSILSRDEAAGLLAPELRAALAQHDPFVEFGEAYARPDADCPLYRAQYADFHTYLTDQILAKVDRASMGVSLEVRVPLLDHRFAERFANLPAHQKISGGRGKHLLRESQRSRLSSEVLDGTKRGFDTPLDAWIRGALREPVAAAIAGLPGDWFDLPRLARLHDEHQRGVRNHGRVLWSLFVLERWRLRHGVRGLSA